MSEIIQGDCLEVMKSFTDNHFTGIVTDPPYGLHFMGKDWDKFNKSICKEQKKTKFFEDKKCGNVIRNANANSGTYDERRNDEFQAFITQFGIEALRIVKPGGHMLMCGAPRRYHRQACGLEDAGWEIRDCLCWLFGSGFPKSHNHFGPEGYGTALKPAYEPILLCMKSLDGTFKQNYEKWGVGGINIDACRIGTDKRLNPEAGFIRRGRNDEEIFLGTDSNKPEGYHEVKGRWPANLLLDEEAASMLDEQSGVLKSDALNRANIVAKNKTYGSAPHQREGLYMPSFGGASRFFYCAKTPSSERNEGCEKNAHPTVKPLALMRYLITLISPPTTALILDPFAGSGSTIVAAEQLGIEAIGIEKQPEYVEIARARLKNEQDKKQQGKLF
jgi:site-specific DNA-methyltransferase (adenine-specific)